MAVAHMRSRLAFIESQSVLASAGLLQLHVGPVDVDDSVALGTILNTNYKMFTERLSLSLFDLCVRETLTSLSSDLQNPNSKRDDLHPCRP